MEGYVPMGVDDLKAYEVEFDKLYDSLPIWELPARPILTALHVVVDSLFNGPRRGELKLGEPVRGAALGARFSYLAPRLLKCDSEPMGIDAADALRAISEVDPEGAYRFALVTYGHFCELMPEVRKGYYDVGGNPADGFRLTHASKEFSAHEAADIILTELSLTFIGEPAPLFPDRFDRQASMWPDGEYDMNLKLRTITEFYNHYCDHLSELPIMTEEGYRAAIGVARDEFERFRAALFAYADYCRGMAFAFERRIRNSGYSDALWHELVEWVSVNWKETFFLGILRGLTKLAPDAIDRLIGIFTLDFRAGKKVSEHAGDGFLPPLARFEGTFIFNPDLLRLFLPARNLLYTINRTDAKRFSDLVSKHMEPELLHAAELMFCEFDRLEVIKNVNWGAGEIDLLVYSAAENAALHIQAKAAIPPQGARMLRAIESRMLEGLDQLRRMRDLNPVERDNVLSRALGRDVRQVKVVDVLLSRASIGTENVWSKLEAAVALNLTLLRISLNKAREQRRTLSLLGFAGLVSTEFRRIMALAQPRWVEREAPLGTTSFRIPFLEFDTRVAQDEQRRAWVQSGS